MLNTDIILVNQALQMLLQAGKNYPNSDLDFSVAYISAVGASWLQPLLKSAKRKRAVVGLCPVNRVNAFLELQDMGVEVYVYVAESKKVFHPKIYYGTTSVQAWAMIGSSNLTRNGLSLNVERNLFLTGQRHTEPFTSIEAQLETFRAQAYPFNADIASMLKGIERRMAKSTKSLSEDDYFENLIDVGLNPKASFASTIPNEVQQVAIETLINFAKSAKLEYAYQMLLLLIMLAYTDENGFLTIEDAIDCFLAFYSLRSNAGLVREVNRGSKKAVIENPRVTRSEVRQMLKESPFPRFEREGLLDLSEDTQYFIVNPALLTAITPSLKQELRALAIQRIAEHFGEDEDIIQAMVTKAIG
jgi:HKD family nuclease